MLTELERHLLDPDILEEAMTRAIEASAADQPDTDARRHSCGEQSIKWRVS